MTDTTDKKTNVRVHALGTRLRSNSEPPSPPRESWPWGTRQHPRELRALARAVEDPDDGDCQACSHNLYADISRGFARGTRRVWTTEKRKAAGRLVHSLILCLAAGRLLRPPPRLPPPPPTPLTPTSVSSSTNSSPSTQPACSRLRVSPRIRDIFVSPSRRRSPQVYAVNEASKNGRSTNPLCYPFRMLSLSLMMAFELSPFFFSLSLLFTIISFEDDEGVG